MLEGQAHTVDIGEHALNNQRHPEGKQQAVNVILPGNSPIWVVIMGSLVLSLVAQFFEPVLNDLKAYLESSQERVSGTATIYLAPYHIEAVTVNSPYDLLAGTGSVYGEYSDFYDAKDAEGASKLHAYEQIIHYNLKKK